MSNSSWENILVDLSAVPVPLDDLRFKQWLAGQRIFVSSTMDGELNPFRDAAREYLEHFAPSVPVMWETISPQDIGPVKAYLSGVDRSSLFVLLLGSSYGAADASGYSPVHQEANHAEERRIHRLVFTLPVAPSARDGKLNRWIRELNIDLSSNSVDRPESFISALDARLRDFAARSQRLWIKLGRCVFPGNVSSEADRQGGRIFTVVAQAFDQEIRQVLMSINDPINRQRGELRLTWPFQSYQVVVENIKQNQQFVGEADIEIVCRTPLEMLRQSGSVQSVNFQGIGPDEQARLWMRHSFFGEVANDVSPMGMMNFLVRPDAPTLPEVIKFSNSTGWQAEGLTSLYVVEESSRTRGIRFNFLAVGPATSGGIPVKGAFVFDQYGQISKPIALHGVVPLSR